MNYIVWIMSSENCYMLLLFDLLYHRKKLSLLSIMLYHLPCKIVVWLVKSIIEENITLISNSFDFSFQNTIFSIESSKSTRNYLTDILIKHPLANIESFQAMNIVWIWKIVRCRSRLIDCYRLEISLFMLHKFSYFLLHICQPA